MIPGSVKPVRRKKTRERTTESVVRIGRAGVTVYHKGEARNT